MVGAAKLSSFGAQGCANHLRFSHFNKFAECIEYLRSVRHATICGIEITPDAAPVHRHPFREGTTAFMVGNEGQGLSQVQLDACDHCVYIPQHAPATASLNVNAAFKLLVAEVMHQADTIASQPPAFEHKLKVNAERARRARTGCSGCSS